MTTRAPTVLKNIKIGIVGHPKRVLQRRVVGGLIGERRSYVTNPPILINLMIFIITTLQITLVTIITRTILIMTS